MPDRVNSSMTKAYSVFPDLIFEGSLPLTSEIESQLNAAITTESNSGSVEETNYGFCTNKFVPLNKPLQNLQQVLLNAYFAEAKKHLPYLEATKTQLELVRPNLVSINPKSNIPSIFERNRYYSGCIWLQATNKSSHLYIECPQGKTYSTPLGLIDYNHYIKPAKYKYVFWPSHLNAGFTPNNSMAPCVLMQYTFTAAVPWDGRPAPQK